MLGAVGLLLALAPLRGGDPAAALREAVLLPSPAERREAALALARRGDVTVGRWLELCRGFGAFDPPPPGRIVTRADLWTPEGAAETELVVDVPAGYDPAEPAPLLLWLHWTGGSGRQLPADAWRGVAEELGMIVLAPSEAGANVGYAFSARERAATLSALRWAKLRFNVDEDRVFATGVSRGGHLAWDLALRRPDLFAGIAPMIGGPRIQVSGGENNVRYLENVARLPIRDLQGARDDPMLVFNLRLCFERLAGWDAPDAELIEFAELGHAFRMDAVDWAAFLGGRARDPRPERVVRAFARPGEGRAFWLEVLAATEEVREEFTPRVSKGLWERLDRFERAEYVQERVDERTARLEGTRTATRFKLEGRRVAAARVLLDEALLPRREALVTFAGRTTRAPVERDAALLLTDFVERLDRAFLPVMAVRVE